MKIKTSELTGAALDWAVAKCEGFAEYDPLTEKMLPPRREYGWVSLSEYRFSTDWAQGGPIIERERIDLQAKINAGSDYDEWLATIGIGAKQRRRYGPTPLIAAMRCYVASKLGHEVEAPDGDGSLYAVFLSRRDKA